LLIGHIGIVWNGPVAQVMVEMGLQVAMAGMMMFFANLLLSLEM
jgi:hypothetical protein